MAGCGGSCGGGGGAKKGDPAKGPSDSGRGSSGDGVAHGCKCVCVCGTTTGDRSRPVDGSVPQDQPGLDVAALAATEEEVAEAEARSRLVDTSGWDRPQEVPWTFYEPPQFIVDTPTVPDSAEGTKVSPYGPGVPPGDQLMAIAWSKERGRHGSSLGWEGAADRQRAAAAPVVSAAESIPPPPAPITYLQPATDSIVEIQRRVLEARAAATAEAIPPLATGSPGGEVQRMSGAATAVLEGPPAEFAEGWSLAPADSTRGSRRGAAATPPDTPPDPPDEVLVADFIRALEALARESDEIERRLRFSAAAIAQILDVREEKRSAGAGPALRKFKEECALLLAARKSIRDLAEESFFALRVGLSSRGEQRHLAGEFLRGAAEAAPGPLREVDRTLRLGWQPISDPDAFLRQLRRRTEDEVERRWRSEGGDREEIRRQVLEEEDARGRTGLLVNRILGDIGSDLLSTAGAVFAVLDTVLARPLRAAAMAVGVPGEYLVRELLDIEHPETYDPWARSQAGRFSREIAQFYGQVAGALPVPDEVRSGIQAFGTIGGATLEVLLDAGGVVKVGGAVAKIFRGAARGGGRVLGGRLATSEALGAVEGGAAGAGGVPPRLWVYTRSPVGDVLTGGAGGRAWASGHAPGAWATEEGLKNALLRMWRTGKIKPFEYWKEIPQSAVGEFERVTGIGPFAGWKYGGRQFFTTRPGDISLITGQIADPTRIQQVRYVGELGVRYGSDTAFWTSVGLGGSLVLAPDDTQEGTGKK